MTKEKNQISKLVIGALALVLLFFVLRFGAAFRFVFVSALIVFALAFGFFYLLNRWKQSRKFRLYKNSPEGKAEQRISYCKAEIEKIENELAQIQNDLEELRKDLSKAKSTRNKEKSKELIKGFEAEIAIRQAKIRFLQRAIDRMEEMLNRHRLSQNLEAKTNKLKQLQEDHFEDLAEMESLRSDLEMDEDEWRRE